MGRAVSAGECRADTEPVHSVGGTVTIVVPGRVPGPGALRPSNRDFQGCGWILLVRREIVDRVIWGAANVTIAFALGEADAGRTGRGALRFDRGMT